MSIDELKHHQRVIDMMLTMHSILRDRNQKRAFFVDLVLFFSAVILNTAVFLDREVLDYLNISLQTSRIVIGVCSIIIFIISLIALRADWKQKEEKHNQAGESLARLKAEIREILKFDNQADQQKIKEQCLKCALTLNYLPKIPESEFLSLKALHKKKVELSKLIDKYPGAPLFVLKFRLWYCQAKGVLLERTSIEKNTGESEQDGNII